MEKEKVSIIIPVYNTEKYLKKCIESIINQTYKNLEIIIVDDGSTDNSSRIIKEYQQKDNRIIGLFQSNFGSPSARNKGIEIATGKYLIFFDSDDEMYEYAVEYLVTNIKDADMIQGNFVSIDENNTILSVHDNLKNDILTNENLKDALKMYPLPGNKMFRNSIIKKYNLIFDNVRIGQDLNFYIKYVGISDKIATIDKLVSKYKHSKGGISRVYNLNVLDIIKSIEMAENFLEQNNKEFMFEESLKLVKIQNYWEQIKKYNNFDKKYRKIMLRVFEIELRKMKNQINSKDIKEFYNFVLLRSIIFKSDMIMKLVRIKNNGVKQGK